jgi:excisionase family DNA binding protein
MADELLLTVGEAARRLGIGRSLLYRLMLEGQVLSVKIGRSRRVPVWALEEFARAKAAEAAEDLDFRVQTLTLKR